MTDIKRYKGQALPKACYMTEFSVKCPKCKHEAVVLADDPFFPSSKGKVQCSNCSFIEKTEDLIRYNVVVKRNCSNCGEIFEKNIPNSKDKMNEMAVSCPNCHETRKYKPRNDAYRVSYNKESPRDPVFHLSLWFQSNIKGNIFWAYNREHLNEIHNYVSSKLREREGTDYTTMVEKLPTFIKAAKNRNGIIKAIEKLMKK